MFIGLWNFCDDAGRHPLKEKQIKAEIFPADDFTADDILGMVQELSENNLITLYVVDNSTYLQVNGWHHQRIDKPQPAKYPEPIDDSSENVLGTFPPDRKGKDSKGEERIGEEGKGKTPVGSASEPDPVDDEFERLWLKRPRRAGNDPKGRALSAFKARLKNGATVEDIEAGMERYTRFCEATGKLDTETVMQFATFCGPDEPWKQDWRIPRQGASLSHSNDDAIARAMGER